MRLYMLAMESEAKDLLDQATLIHKEPFPLYQIKEKKVLIAISGIGKVNAAMTLTAIINNYKVKEIVNIGFAGATKQYTIGQVVVVNEATYHDFDLTFFGYEKGQVPNMPVSYKKTLDLAKLEVYEKVTLYTGDYFMEDPMSDNFISDMEATALFQVAHIYNIPMVSIKVISDIIGITSQKDVYSDFEKMGSKYILDVFNSLEVR